VDLTFVGEQRWRRRLLHVALGLVAVVACASCGDDGETQAPVLADDVPVAHTPPGGYGATFPPPVLARCTEPLVAVVRSGRPAPADDPVYSHIERIEQCGNRLVVTGGGVIHDMRCDGTAENGVNDVAAATGQPIQVIATYENGVHVLRPVGLAGIEITRQLEGDQMLWNYLNFVAHLRRSDAPE
jgi:hypothetical protein